MIKTENLTKQFADFTALDNINCTIENGTIYGLVGSNGSGKSTLLRVLSGVYKPDSGTATIDGAPIFENPSAKAKIAYVPDELYYPMGATMDRIASMYKSLYPSFNCDRYATLAKDLSLNRQKSLNTFSKGMRRQAMTVLSLATEPDVIFFDETFDGLDPVMRNYVKKLICLDIVDRGASAIITSHSLRELEDTCDQLALLHKGGLVFESDIENLRTERFKIQIAFTESYDITKFEGINIVKFTKSGSVANLIVNGDREDIVAKLQTMNPMILDVLPLTLEEVFTYEMEALGYSFVLD